MRLLLEEYAPKIIYIEGIHNTVADAVFRLEYNPKLNPTDEHTHAMLGVSTKEESAHRWKLFLHYWQSYNKSNVYTQTCCISMNKVLANHSKEGKFYPLTTSEIAEA